MLTTFFSCIFTTFLLCAYSYTPQGLGSLQVTDTRSSGLAALPRWLNPVDFQSNITFLLSDAVRCNIAVQGMECVSKLRSKSPLEAVFECLNSQQSSESFSWQAYVKGGIGAVKAAGVFSAKRTKSSNIPLTIITSISIHDFPQLYAQCLSWAGPMAAAVYVPLVQQLGPLSEDNVSILHVAIHLIAQFIADMREEADACQPDVLLSYEIMEDEVSQQVLYPSNLLRSMARLMTRTPLVAFLDPDLLVSRSLSWRLKDDVNAAELVEKVVKERLLLVIPAFKIRGRSKVAWAEALASGGKAMMTYASMRNITFQYDVNVWPAGHSLTDYVRWVNSTHDYDVAYEFMCEPYVIADRLNTPWHDARYRGKGVDRMQMLEDAYSQGFKFRVLYDAFVVQRPDPQEAFKRPYPTKEIRQYTQGLFKLQRDATFQRHAVEAVLDPGTKRCKLSLSWWNADGRPVESRSPIGIVQRQLET